MAKMLTIFGATGYTGTFIATYMASSKAFDGITIKLAGRDRTKLSKLAEKLFREHGRRTEIVVADVSDASSLSGMARGTQLVLNAVGPFMLYGEAVVAACVEAGTDYVDITGEPEFMERMEQRYHETAMQQKCLVVSSCGFDSIPADIGAAYAEDVLAARGGVCTQVESFLTWETPAGFGVHYGTFESAVRGVSRAPLLRKLRSQMAAASPLYKLPAFGRRLKHGSGIFYSKQAGALLTAFPGADASVVKRTQRQRALLGDFPLITPAGTVDASRISASTKVPIQFAAYVTIPSYWAAFWLVLYGAVFSMLVRFAWGRRLLLAYPKVFCGGICSHEGPNAEQLARTRTILVLHARGYDASVAPAVLAAPAGGVKGSVSGSAPSAPNVSCVVRVAGGEPGYIYTSRLVGAAALTMLQDRQCLPTGGVLTPAAAFYRPGSKIVDRLQEAGTEISVIGGTSDSKQ